MKIRVKMLADIEPPEAIEQGDWIYRREDLNIFLSVWQWNFRKVMKQSWHHDLLCLNAEELS